MKSNGMFKIEEKNISQICIYLYGYYENQLIINNYRISVLL